MGKLLTWQPGGTPARGSLRTSTPCTTIIMITDRHWWAYFLAKQFGWMWCPTVRGSLCSGDSVYSIYIVSSEVRGRWQCCTQAAATIATHCATDACMLLHTLDRSGASSSFAHRKQPLNTEAMVITFHSHGLPYSNTAGTVGGTCRGYCFGTPLCKIAFCSGVPCSGGDLALLDAAIWGHPVLVQTPEVACKSSTRHKQAH